LIESCRRALLSDCIQCFREDQLEIKEKIVESLKTSIEAVTAQIEGSKVARRRNDLPALKPTLIEEPSLAVCSQGSTNDNTPLKRPEEINYNELSGRLSNEKVQLSSNDIVNKNIISKDQKKKVAKKVSTLKGLTISSSIPITSISVRRGVSTLEDLQAKIT